MKDLKSKILEGTIIGIPVGVVVTLSSRADNIYWAMTYSASAIVALYFGIYLVTELLPRVFRFSDK